MQAIFPNVSIDKDGFGGVKFHCYLKINDPEKGKYYVKKSKSMAVNLRFKILDELEQFKHECKITIEYYKFDGGSDENGRPKEIGFNGILSEILNT